MLTGKKTVKVSELKRDFASYKAAAIQAAEKGGGTALYDAIGQGLKELHDVKKAVAEVDANKDVPKHYMLLVLTDGEDMHSKTVRYI